MAAATADTLQSVELADGVEIHLRVAGPGARCLAWLIDLLIYGGVVLVMQLALGIASGILGGEIAQGLNYLLMFILLWLYNVFFETGRKAATPGQRSMGLKVASVSGAPVRLPQSIIRNLLRVVDFMPGFYLFGLLCCLSSRKFQRLGDLVADTVVVYADEKEKPQPPLLVNAEPLPPSTALTREEQAALIQFLERAPRWSDERKVELSDVLEPLSGNTGLAGLTRVCGVALWVRNQGGRPLPSRIPPPAPRPQPLPAAWS